MPELVVDQPLVNETSIDAKTLLQALTAYRKGDFSARLPLEWTGVAGKVADAFNEVIELNERLAAAQGLGSAASSKKRTR